jgi:hypothetical protein
MAIEAGMRRRPDTGRGVRSARGDDVASDRFDLAPDPLVRLDSEAHLATHTRLNAGDVVAMLKRIVAKARKALGAPRAPSARRDLRRNLGCEILEMKRLLSGSSNDYVLSGYTWAAPAKITYSIPADGIPWDGGTNNLNATLNAEYGPTWKVQFAKALQTWAAASNINVVPVADNNAPFNSAGLLQGDPNFGDIRIGGYNFNDNQLLAQTYYPPPNGVTAAGDVEFNTGFSWPQGGQFDLFSVMLHEVGHSFGLNEAPSGSPSVMEAIYGGVRTGLTAGDVSGLQKMYGPRRPDSLQGAGGATSFATAYDLTNSLATVAPGVEQVTLANLSLASIGDTEYFTFVAPPGVNESAIAAASSMGLSSLSPKLTVLDASMKPISPYATAAFPGQFSDFAGVPVGLVYPGQRYYVAVTGATNDVFSVGAYALQLTFKGVTAGGTTTPPPVSAPPPVTTPPAPVTPPAPPSQPIISSFNLGTIGSTTLPAQSLPTARNIDVFTFIPVRTGTVAISTGSTLIQIVNQSGHVIAAGVGTVSFSSKTPGARYFAVVSTANGQPVPSFSFSINVATTSAQYAPATAGTAGSTRHVTPSTDAHVATTPVRVAPRASARPHQRIESVNPRWAKVGG